MEWIITKTDSIKFPYRLLITDRNEIILSLLVQDKWPGIKNIFCYRDNEIKENEEVVEKVEILSLRRYGKRMVVVLNRKTNKRCQFIFLKKKYKEKEGEYEQIFWSTTKALKEKKPKSGLLPYIKTDLNIIIDKNERYPYKFQNAKIERAILTCGDYALIDENRNIIAVVERKTFENFLDSISNMHIFHQFLSELENYKYNALIIEANYSDFFKPEKIKFYKVEFCARAISEIYSFHPNLKVIFTGNRKLAEIWILKFFLSVKNKIMERPHIEIKEKIPEYFSFRVITDEYLIERFNNLPVKFTFSEMKNLFSEVKQNTLRNFLKKMEKEGKVKKEKIGKENVYYKL
ncbi:MAG: ERCC4 domain-containing protein [Candidatus Ratteibacteria bacterium]